MDRRVGHANANLVWRKRHGMAVFDPKHSFRFAEFVVDDFSYPSYRANIWKKAQRSAWRQTCVLTANPVAHRSRNCCACCRKSFAYCDCAPWLASGYITNLAFWMFSARRKLLIGGTTISLLPCTTNVGW
jgi:hypothetical protein